MRGAVADAQIEYRDARLRYIRALGRATATGADPAVLLEWRWLLEEYAVHLFAQDLRTRVPISGKRLAAVEAASLNALQRQ
jgi:hypothetical protein